MSEMLPGVKAFPNGDRAKDLSPEELERTLADLDERHKATISKNDATRSEPLRTRSPAVMAFGLGVVIFVAVLLAMIVHDEYLRYQLRQALEGKR